ncbi:MAG TPA: acyl-CoA dehydrogenase [Planctomycetes bacterium]|nr:acyl-CoA dehydrogenase [Planctomycetota bacterium]
MDFDLDETLLAQQAEARAFASEKVAPGAADRARLKEFPEALVREAGAKGWMGCLVPKAEGGSGIGNLGQAVVLEEIAVACAGTHVTISVHNSLACGALYAFGGDSLKALYLRKLATGEWLGCYMLTEADSGSDAAAMKTTAVRDGDDWVLNGEKMWITSADVSQFAVVFARTNPDPAVKNTRAISAFAVPMDTPGIEVGKREEKLGLASSTTCSVALRDVRIPADHLMGELDEGFKIAMEMLNGGRIGVAVQGVGLARAALEAAIDWAADAPLGGRPRTKDQRTAFALSEIATEIEAARLLAWRAAWLRDKKKNHIREASEAKLFATRVANNVCRKVVALMGEAGYGDAQPVERLMRDVRVTELYEGTTEIQKLVISRQILPR